MVQGQYISKNEEVDGNSIYDDLNFYYGNYIFDGKTYSIWKFTKEAMENKCFYFPTQIMF
jgi:hypothetical protein